MKFVMFWESVHSGDRGKFFHAWKLVDQLHSLMALRWIDGKHDILGSISHLYFIPILYRNNNLGVFHTINVLACFSDLPCTAITGKTVFYNHLCFQVIFLYNGWSYQHIILTTAKRIASISAVLKYTDLLKPAKILCSKIFYEVQ